MKSTLWTSVLGALALISVGPGAGSAAPTDDARAQVTALAKQAIDAFNKGDIATVKSLMAAGGQSIIDEMPPFAWSGKGAVDAWLSDVQKDDERMKDTDGVSVLGPPTFVRVEGDRAYAVFADHFRYSRAGAVVNEDATLTLTAQKGAAGWRIVSFAYSAGAH